MVGYLHELQDQGIEDPIAMAKAKVEQLNEKLRWIRAKDRKLLSVDEYEMLGYFPMKQIQNGLSLTFEKQEIVETLVYQTLVHGSIASEEKVSKLVRCNDYTKEEMEDALASVTKNYEDILSQYTKAIKKKYGVSEEQLYVVRGRVFGDGCVYRLGCLFDANKMLLGMKLFALDASLDVMVEELKTMADVTGDVIVDDEVIEELFEDFMETIEKMEEEIEEENFDCVFGRFVIRCIADLLFGILQHQVLKDRCSYETLSFFVKEFRVLELDEHGYLKLVPHAYFFQEYGGSTGFWFEKEFVIQSDIDKMLGRI